MACSSPKASRGNDYAHYCSGQARDSGGITGKLGESWGRCGFLGEHGVHRDAFNARVEGAYRDLGTGRSPRILVRSQGGMPMSEEDARPIEGILIGAVIGAVIIVVGIVVGDAILTAAGWLH